MKSRVKPTSRFVLLNRLQSAPIRSNGRKCCNFFDWSEGKGPPSPCSLVCSFGLQLLLFSARAALARPWRRFPALSKAKVDLLLETPGALQNEDAIAVIRQYDACKMRIRDFSCLDEN